MKGDSTPSSYIVHLFLLYLDIEQGEHQGRTGNPTS